MSSQRDYQPPKRKEPGTLGKLFTALIQFITWLVVGLIVSIGIEWVGMKYYWPEQGSDHAKAVLATDQNYLNQQLADTTLTIKSKVIDMTRSTNEWIDKQRWFKTVRQSNDGDNQLTLNGFNNWLSGLKTKYRDYIQASKYVSQIFVIRLGLLIFSLPVFIMAIVVGTVDGLVERDLRRWGGGRESSNVFKLAKRSITPLFVLACVVYISLPMSLNPVIIILPFAIMVGLSVRITFERLKKYF